MSEQHKREAVSAEQMAYSNRLTVNALVEVLDERGRILKQEISTESRRCKPAFRAVILGQQHTF